MHLYKNNKLLIYSYKYDPSNLKVISDKIELSNEAKEGWGLSHRVKNE